MPAEEVPQLPDRPEPGLPTRVLDALWRVGLRSAYRGLCLYWFLARPKVVGCYVVVWVRGHVLVIHNSYKGYATVPGGRVDRGEEPRDAAARELREEVGIDLAPERLRDEGPERGFVQHHHEESYFYSVVLDEVPRVAIDRREVVRAYFSRPEQMLAGEVAPMVRQHLESRAGSSPV